MESIGIIAGSGLLPLILSERIKTEGNARIIAIGLKGLSLQRLSDFVDIIHWVGPEELGKLIEILKKEGIRKAIMAGKVPKTLIFDPLEPDLRGAAILKGLRNKKDDSILRALAEELDSEGIAIEGLKTYLSPFFTKRGVLTSRGPSEEEIKDIIFGWEIAKGIGRLDIGQTVVVKNQAVLAVEAIEGTDEAIRRGGRLGRGNVVVIKVSKPGQDMRFDVPVVGLTTIEVLKEVNGRVLALEAEKTILLDKEVMIREADRMGLSIIGIELPCMF